MSKAQIKKIIIAALILVLVFGVFVVSEKIIDKKNQTEIIDTDPINHTIQTVLLIGIDEDKQETSDIYINQAQADFLFLLIINPSTKEISALQINRDTICDVTVIGALGDKVCKEPMQIALSHTYGTGGKDSCQNTTEAVNDLLGITVDHYVAATMDIVGELNDAIGGVTLIPAVTIDDEIIEGQEITLKGDQALEYIRARQEVSDGTNLSRMERQRQYIDAAMDKINNAKDNNNIDSLLSESDKLNILENVISDCSTERLKTIFDQSTTFTFTGIETLKGEALTSADGYIEYHLDDTALQSTIEKLFYK